MRPLALLFVCAVVLPVPVAQAWTWPVDGAVLRPFSFDRAHPYAGGQHRGVDLAAPAGTPVVAPAEGVVSFTGTVPTGGKTVSIQTPLGYTATLLHLGSIGVTRGARVQEGATVGTVGPSGVAAHSDPYVYFGLRETSDPQGYVDPLPFLPARAVTSGPTVTGAAAAVAAPAAEALPAASPSAPAPVAKAAVAQPAPTPAVEAAVETTRADVVPATEDAPAVVPEASLERFRPTVRVVAPASISPGVAEPARPSIGRAARARSAASAAVPITPTAGTARTTPKSEARTRSHSSGPDRGSAHLATAHGDTGASRALATALAVGALMLLLALVFALRAKGLRTSARIMSVPEPEHVVGQPEQPQEDPGRARLAVRSRETTSRPRGRVRRAGGHLRAVPPTEGQRRPDGERNRRARHAGDGDRGSRRRLAA